MKKIFSNIGVGLLITLGLILLKIFTGISIWLMVGIVLFFTVVRYLWTGGIITAQSRTLASVLAFLFLSALGFSYWQANYPLSYQKIVVLKGRADLKASELMGDRTKTLAEYMWEFRKDENGKKFLTYYDSLLAKGDTKNAFDTMTKFTEAWDLSLLEKNRKAENSQVIPERRAPDSQDNSLTEYWKAGEYPLNLTDGQESGWLKISGQCLSYTFTNSRATFILTYKDGTIAHSWDGKPWPGKFIFKVKNLSREPISLKLSS